MKQVTLIELSSPGCSHCRAFEEFWRSVEKEWPNVTYKNVSVVSPEGQKLAGDFMILSSPGVIVNNELFSMGGVDKKKFLERIRELSQ